MVRLMILASCFAMVACQAPEVEQTSTAVDTAAKLSGAWQITQLEGQSLVEGSSAYVTFSTDGALSGNSGCNQFVGNYTLSDNDLNIERGLASTRKMCLPAVMQQEQKILAVFDSPLQFTLEGGAMSLHNTSGSTLLQAIPFDDK